MSCENGEIKRSEDRSRERESEWGTTSNRIHVCGPRIASGYVAYRRVYIYIYIYRSINSKKKQNELPDPLLLPPHVSQLIFLR